MKAIAALSQVIPAAPRIERAAELASRRHAEASACTGGLHDRHAHREAGESPLMSSLQSALAVLMPPADAEGGRGDDDGAVAERLEEFAKTLMHALRRAERHDRGLHLGWYCRAEHCCETPARRIDALAAAAPTASATPDVVATATLTASVDATTTTAEPTPQAEHVPEPAPQTAQSPQPVPPAPAPPAAAPWAGVFERLREAFESLQDALKTPEDERPALTDFLRALAASLDAADDDAPVDARATAPGALVELAA